MKNTDFVKAALGEVGHGYWYGTYVGHVSSEALLASKAKQYPKQYTSTYIKRSRRWLDGSKYKPPAGYSKTPNAPAGTPVTDCSGLVKGIVWRSDFGGKYQASSDLSANGMFGKCPKTGLISSIPEVPGLLVWKNNHIGIYIGGNLVVEARGADYGVVKTNLKDRGWQKWGYCHLIDYSETSEEKEIAKLKAKISELQIDIVKYVAANKVLEKEHETTKSKLHSAEICLDEQRSEIQSIKTTWQKLNSLLS